jgi:hypothetical protein
VACRIWTKLLLPLGRSIRWTIVVWNNRKLQFRAWCRKPIQKIEIQNRLSSTHRCLYVVHIHILKDSLIIQIDFDTQKKEMCIKYNYFRCPQKFMCITHTIVFLFLHVSVCAITVVLIFWDNPFTHGTRKDDSARVWNGPWWKHSNRGTITDGTLFSSHLILFISSIGPGQCLHLVLLSGQVMLWNANVGPTLARHKICPGLLKDAAETWQQNCLRRLVSHPVMLKYHVHDLDLNTKLDSCVHVCLKQLRHDRLIHLFSCLS